MRRSLPQGLVQEKHGPVLFDLELLAVETASPASLSEERGAGVKALRR